MLSCDIINKCFLIVNRYRRQSGGVQVWPGRSVADAGGEARARHEAVRHARPRRAAAGRLLARRQARRRRALPATRARSPRFAALPAAPRRAQAAAAAALHRLHGTPVHQRHLRPSLPRHSATSPGREQQLPDPERLSGPERGVVVDLRGRLGAERAGRREAFRVRRRCQVVPDALRRGGLPREVGLSAVQDVRRRRLCGPTEK